MKKITVAVQISAAAALRRNSSEAGRIIWEVPADLPQELKNEVAGFPTGRDGADFSCPFSVGGEDEIIPELERKVAACQAEAARKRAEEDAWMEFARRAPAEAWLNHGYGESPWSVRQIPDGAPYCGGAGYSATEGHFHRHPDLAAVRAEAQRIADQRNAEIAEGLRQAKERRQAEEEAKRRAEAEAAARRTAQLNAWVSAHGTENQQARHRIGLLPESEILDGIRSAAFATLDTFPRYERLSADALEHDEYCEGSVSYEGTDAAEATSEEYETMTAIAKAVPEGATVTLRLHVGECSQCEATAERKGILVKVAAGELKFSREYAA